MQIVGVILEGCDDFCVSVFVDAIDLVVDFVDAVFLDKVVKLARFVIEHAMRTGTDTVECIVKILKGVGLCRLQGGRIKTVGYVCIGACVEVTFSWDCL